MKNTSRHRKRTMTDAMELEPFHYYVPQSQTVWVDTRGHQVPGQVSQEANTPRSYFTETCSGELRRNQAHLRVRTNL